MASYRDAEDYSYYSGRVASDVLKTNITSDVYAGGTLTAEDAVNMIVPVLEKNYEYVSNATAAVQKKLNQNAGLGMNAVIPEFDRDRANRLAEKFTEYEDYEDAEFILGDETVTNSQSVADEMLRENASFHYEAGLRPKIIRTAEAGCCKWCAGLEGEYEYSRVPKEVFQRHNNCRCEIEYDPGTGKVQNAHTKTGIDRDKRIRLYARAKAERESEEKKERKYRRMRIYYPDLFDSTRNFFNDEKDELIGNNFSLVKPIDKFTDFGIHGAPHKVDFTSRIGQETDFTAKEFADMLRLNSSYPGGNIRLIACQTGKEEYGFASQLAEELGVKVMAPTEDVWIDDTGEMFISDNTVLADLWYDGYEVKETGRWRTFPEESGEELI